MRSKTARLLFLFLAVAATASLTFSQKRNITEKDMFDFQWVADPQISPDGSTVAFVKVTVNDKKDDYNTSIWSVSTADGETHQLTAGIHDSSPRWSPDGKYLAFVRVTEKTAGPTRLSFLCCRCRAAIRGSLPAFRAVRAASAGRRTGSGSSSATVKMPPRSHVAASPHPPPADGHESDVKVITRAGYRSNGAGYLDFTHPGHIWVVAAPHSPEEKVTPKQLTSGNFNEGGAVWAPDSSAHLLHDEPQSRAVLRARHDRGLVGLADRRSAADAHQGDDDGLWRFEHQSGREAIRTARLAE